MLLLRKGIVSLRKIGCKYRNKTVIFQIYHYKNVEKYAVWLVLTIAINNSIVLVFANTRSKKSQTLHLIIVERSANIISYFSLSYSISCIF